MAPVGTLWGHARWQRQTQVILCVAALNGLELNQPVWEFTNKPSEFITKFPYGKIPTFEGTDGLKLFEGLSIARYLSSIGTINLLGSSTREVAIVDQWTHFSEHEIGIPIQTINGIVYGYLDTFNLESINRCAERLARALDYAESHLASRPSGYVALDTLTLADLVLASQVNAGARICLGAAERARYPHVLAHYAKVTEDERVRQFWGTEEFIDVPITEARTFPYT